MGGQSIFGDWGDEAEIGGHVSAAAFQRLTFVFPSCAGLSWLIPRIHACLRRAHRCYTNPASAPWVGGAARRASKTSMDGRDEHGHDDKKTLPSQALPLDPPPLGWATEDRWFGVE